MGMPKIVRRTSGVAVAVAAPVAEVVQLHQTDEVLATVPKAFQLTDDDHNPHKYPVGTYMMTREHAMHWYSKANGVTLANTTKPATA